VEKKSRQIPDYKPGDVVNDLFVVRFKKPVRSAKNGKYFFELKLQDAGGDIMFKFWGSENEQAVQALYDSILSDSVIKVVNGMVGFFNDKTDMSVNEGEGKITVLKKGEYDIKDFIKISDEDPEVMLKELKTITGTVKDKELKAVINIFFNDVEFVEKFKLSPAAMYKHHGWVSGLLEHTLTVVKICDDISKYHPKLNRDLLITGAFLHDIGKIEEFETTTQIKVSDKGNMLGHISLGIQMLTKRFESLKISDITKQKLLHMLISHHGHKEFGSPKEPCFPEALLLYKVDEIDAYITQMTDYKDDANTEDSFVYSKDFGNIYLK
jgi:3'-5' exoribonuclease